MPEQILPDPGSGYQFRPTPGAASRPRRAPVKRSPELHTLGRAVLELRARRGLSQEQLGADAGLRRNYVGAIERGEINPTFRVLLKLCAGLQLPLSELMAVRERHGQEQDRPGPYQPSPVARTHDR